MEIRPYWHRMGNRRWLLLLAPLVAGLIACMFGIRQPTRYQAVGIATIPVSGLSPIATRQAVFDVQAVASSREYFDEVAGLTGTSGSKISQGLKVAQVQGGNLLEFRYQSKRPETADRVSRTAAHVALQRYFVPQVSEAKQTVDAAQQALDEANQAIADLVEKAGVPAPRDTYNSALQIASQLRVRQAVAATDPATASQAPAYAKPIADAQAEADKLADLVREYDVVVARRDRIAAALGDAVNAHSSVVARQNTAAGEAAVSGLLAGRVPRLPSIIQMVISAVVVAELAAAGLLLLIELLGSGSKRPPLTENQVLERSAEPAATVR